MHAIRFFMLHYDQIMWVWPYTWGSGCLLLLALPFLGARMSPVVSMTTAMPAVGALRMTKSTCWKWGNLSGISSTWAFCRGRTIAGRESGLLAARIEAVRGDGAWGPGAEQASVSTARVGPV